LEAKYSKLDARRRAGGDAPLASGI